MRQGCRRVVAGITVAVGLTIASVSVAGDEVQDLYRASYQLEAARDYSGALTKMRAIMASSGSSYVALLRSAWLAYLAGDFAASEMGYKQAADKVPKSIEAKLGLTLVQAARKNWKGVQGSCLAIMASDPTHVTARARLASAYYQAGNYPDAATVYRKLLEEYPAEPDYQTGLGWALAKMGRKGEAKQLFEGVLAFAPDNANAKLGLAVP